MTQQLSAHYKGWFYCSVRKDFFRWPEFIDFDCVID